jgi:hypothetical protein
VHRCGARGRRLGDGWLTGIGTRSIITGVVARLVDAERRHDRRGAGRNHVADKVGGFDIFGDTKAFQFTFAVSDVVKQRGFGSRILGFAKQLDILDDVIVNLLPLLGTSSVIMTDRVVTSSTGWRWTTGNGHEFSQRIIGLEHDAAWIVTEK